jgi:pyridoxamine 5'-phosphate oxidase
MTIADLRREYASRALGEEEADTDPLKQFSVWFGEALKSELLDVNAMTLATATPAGEPAARIVLLKGFDEHGFVFFTNYESAKGRELAANPRACLLLFWR